MEYLKFILLASTASFGLVGLWIDKNKRPIERKILIAAILTTFAISITMSVLEVRTAQLKDSEHNAEVRRLLQPIDRARLHVKLKVSAIGVRSPGLAAILKHFRTEAGTKPARGILPQLTERLPLTESIKRELSKTGNFDLFFFRKSSNTTCNDLSKHIPSQFDLVLTTLDAATFDEPDSGMNAIWVYQYYPPHHYEALFLERDLDLHFAESNHSIVGVEDIEGSTMVIFGQMLEDYEISDFEFSPRDGVHFELSGQLTPIHNDTNIGVSECIRWYTLAQ